MGTSSEKGAPSPPAGSEAREILVAHAGEIRPVTAVKFLLMQSSIAQLEQGGLFARYAEVVEPKVLARIRSGLASEWAPVELAEAHYQACDGMGLSDEQLRGVGQRVGDRLQETTLVWSGKGRPAVDVFEASKALIRMWPRHYQGGSVQAIKLGPNNLLYELCSFRLNRFRHYRVGQLAVFRAAYEAIGVQLQSARILSYSAPKDEVHVSVSW